MTANESARDIPQPRTGDLRTYQREVFVEPD
ncbi:MAG: hypothetical protein RLZZ450_4561, partial [Pseudomonadota bacterium]